MEVPTTKKNGYLIMNNKIREIQISYKGESNLPVIKDSKDCLNFIMNNWDNTISIREQFKVVFLSRSSRAKGIFILSQGGLSSTTVDIKLLFSVALKTLSSGIILIHNDPSGNLQPSRKDEKITIKIKQACKLLDISLLDHLILTPNRKYFSFADEGLL